MLVLSLFQSRNIYRSFFYCQQNSFLYFFQLYEQLLFISPLMSKNNSESQSFSDESSQLNNEQMSERGSDVTEQSNKNIFIDKNLKKHLKKQIKHIFQLLAKSCSYQLFNKARSWYLIVIKLLQSKKNKIQRFLEYSLQQKKFINCMPTVIVNKSLKYHKLLILVLSIRIISQKISKNYYDIELISAQSKIIYKIINLKSWQNVFAQIFRVESQGITLIKLIYNKSQRKELQQKNHEFKKFIQNFLQIENVQSTYATKMEEATFKSEQKLQEIKYIMMTIKKYQFIKQSICQELKKRSQQMSIDEVIAATILYNVAVLIPKQTFNLNELVKPFYAIIFKIMRNQYQSQQRKINSKPINSYHLPQHLQNAQICWKCKQLSKRSYIGCSACSVSEKKQVSLCLDCYQSHHEQLKPISFSSMLQTLNKRDSQNLRVQSMINLKMGIASNIKLEQKNQ